MNNPRKPKMSAEELVRKMRDEKGITFNYMSERDAVQYLRNTENYMRAASYRKNYTKIQGGKNDGKYEDLDFAYLIELSEIDECLRMVILKMCLDIEHALKVRMIRDISDDQGCDGYTIVSTFLEENPKVVESIEAKVGSSFVGGLIDAYFGVSDSVGSNGSRQKHHITDYSMCPVWVLLELLTFGEFVRFFDFYYKEHAPIRGNIMKIIKALRNGVAHNNCILASLCRSEYSVPHEIQSAVQSIPAITKSQRKSKLAVRHIVEFTTMLYVYSKVVADWVKAHRVEELHVLFYIRMRNKKEYFCRNNTLISCYRFACTLIDSML